MAAESESEVILAGAAPADDAAPTVGAARAGDTALIASPEAAAAATVGDDGGARGAAGAADLVARDVLRRAALLGLGVGAAVLLGSMLWPFLPAIALAAAVAAITHPLYQRLSRRVRQPSLAAFTATAIIFLLGVVPAAALALVLSNEIAGGLEWLRGRELDLLDRDGPVYRFVGSLAAQVGLDPANVSTALGRQLEQLAGSLADRAFAFVSGLGGWLLQAGAALFTLYYLLKDGDRLVAELKRLLPLRPAQADRLIGRAREVLDGTIYGNVLVALVQGALGGLAFAVLRVPGAALWGSIMALLSLLPVVGAFLVWMPAGLLLVATGRLAAGIALLAFGTLVISTVDNLLRAILVSDRAQLHPLVVFFSVLGGLVVFGAAGVLIGPVVFVVAYTALEAARASLDPTP